MALNTRIAADHDAPPITKLLAEYVASHPSAGWDDAVDHEARRTFLNWLGCAVGAARHAAPEAALAAIAELQPAAQASLVGRSEKVDMASAAFINGISSHTFDFDDTHLRSLVHPAGPVASAVLALAECRHIGGREVTDALVMGVDVACRMANVVYPDHYDRGWHITGTTGMLGAAAACARLLKLDVHQTQMALSLAASQPTGLREQFGTMAKPFHPGAAARAGLMSALLAAKGFTASPRALEAARGWAQVVSTKTSWNEAIDALGQRFEISFNSYKPFACGVVIHPSIDACVQLREQGVRAEEVDRIELRVHPLVLELTGKKEPANGLQGKFSIYHGCAAGLVFGRAGEAEFADAIVNRADVVALRRKVVVQVDEGVDEASADVTAFLRGGRQCHVFVEHALGTLHRPLTDGMLEAKFRQLVEPVLGLGRADPLVECCWRLEAIEDMGEITALARA